MKDILEIMIKHLVDNPDAVEIIEKLPEDDGPISLEVKVAPEDVGKVIGKQGKIARAIRTVMKSVATKDRKKVNIEFLD